MKGFNIYLTGVGGQGIGLISEIILRAADHGGHAVRSVDTHGLAQRGGIVVSQIRMGPKVYSPLIPIGQADLAISLERHEALRAAGTMLKVKGTLIYYNTVWQPLSVRLNESPEVSEAEVAAFCRQGDRTVITVFQADLADIRMQNMVILREICHRDLIPGIDRAHYEKAMQDLMSGTMLERNRAVFNAGP